MQTDDNKKLLEENLKVSKEILENTKHIRSSMFWSKVWFYIKLVLVLIPFILAAIYLPPLIRQFGAGYSQLFGGSEQGTILQQFKNLNPSNLSEILKLAPEGARQQLENLRK